MVLNVNEMKILSSLPLWFSPHQQGVKGQRLTGMNKPWPPRGFLLPAVRHSLSMYEMIWTFTVSFKSVMKMLLYLHFLSHYSLFYLQIVLWAGPFVSEDLITILESLSESVHPPPHFSCIDNSNYAENRTFEQYIFQKQELIWSHFTINTAMVMNVADVFY